jgi:hypothetical protein
MKPKTPGTPAPAAPDEYITKQEVEELFLKTQRKVQSINDKGAARLNKEVRKAEKLAGYIIANVKANRPEIILGKDKSFVDKGIQKATTQTQEWASQKPTLNLSDNPLLLLVTGPLNREEMLNLCYSLMPEVLAAEHRQTLEDPGNQNYQHMPILVPDWWDKSPEQFVQKLNEYITLRHFSLKEPQARWQLRLLEVLLSMLADHLYGQAD